MRLNLETTTIVIAVLMMGGCAENGVQNPNANEQDSFADLSTLDGDAIIDDLTGQQAQLLCDEVLRLKEEVIGPVFCILVGLDGSDVSSCSEVVDQCLDVFSDEDDVRCSFVDENKGLCQATVEQAEQCINDMAEFLQPLASGLFCELLEDEEASADLEQETTAPVDEEGNSPSCEALLEACPEFFLR